MAISTRLKTSMNTRPDAEQNEDPLRIIFLSVEGKVTEKNYFDYVNKHRRSLGIHSLVKIETLNREDTRSDLESIYSLIDECLRIKSTGILPSDLYDVLNNIRNQRDIYSQEYLAQYLSDELPEDEANIITRALNSAGIDINYNKYIAEMNGQDGDDIFAVVLDRDRDCHSRNNMIDLMNRCQTNGIRFYITNPCFEFWLLLHLCDVRSEYGNELDQLLLNRKVSNKHTYVSLEVNKKARHSKSIPEGIFIAKYLNSIDDAIRRASLFEQDKMKLLDNLGTNIPELFELLREVR
jgi:hypothetical protein